jgi:hypothetical protein
MVYEVLEPASKGRFELERSEPLKEDELFTQFDMTYKVLRVLPGNDQFDAGSRSPMSAVERRRGTKAGKTHRARPDRSATQTHA